MLEEYSFKDKEEIRLALEKDDDFLVDFFASISHASDIIEIFRLVAVEKWPRLLSFINDKEQKASIISRLDPDEWYKLLPLLSPREIAEVIKELETDDAADLLAEVPLANRMAALRMLSPKERQQVQQLLKYPQDCAGGIMQLELALVDEGATVLDTINIVRELVEEDVEVLSVLVVDKQNRLVGSLALVDLLLNKATKNVSEIMDKEVMFVKPLVDQEEVALLFKKYDLIMLPVVDDNNRVLGRIVIDDIVDVLQEEAEEDALHMAGTSVEELLYQTSVFSTARIRMPWLGIALCCSLLSATLLHLFEATMSKAVIILSFIPVITAMGGNVGTQSATVLIRGFATNKFDLSHVPKFLFKEIRVSMVIGLSYGFLTALVATFLLTNYNFYLGFVVFCAMVCGMMTAAILGVIAPTLLKKFNIDPAIASGPFVTTLNDITGILIYMLICTLFLAKLQVG